MTRASCDDEAFSLVTAASFDPLKTVVLIGPDADDAWKVSSPPPSDAAASSTPAVPQRSAGSPTRATAASKCPPLPRHPLRRRRLVPALARPRQRPSRPRLPRQLRIPRRALPRRDVSPSNSTTTPSTSMPALPPPLSACPGLIAAILFLARRRASSLPPRRLTLTRCRASTPSTLVHFVHYVGASTARGAEACSWIRRPPRLPYDAGDSLRRFRSHVRARRVTRWVGLSWLLCC